MARKKDDKKIQPLRMYLLKSSVTKVEDALRDNVKLNEYSLKSSPGINGKFFLRPAIRNTPDWAEFVQSGIKDKLPKIESVANAGVLFLTIDKSIVALVFGTR